MPTRGGRLRPHATIRRVEIPIDVQGDSQAQGCAQNWRGAWSARTRFLIACRYLRPTACPGRLQRGERLPICA